MTFNVHVLPATYGDCIWLEYGENGDRYHVLIDGGTGGTRNAISKMLGRLPENERHFELLIITHVDRDHIEGVLNLMEKEDPGFTAGDCWFNAWPQIEPFREAEAMGPEQGERLSGALLKHGFPWNEAFGGKAVMAGRQLPRFELRGGMTITVLSPYEEQLRKLTPFWVSKLKEEGLEPGFGLEEQEEGGERGAIERMGAAAPDIDELNDTVFKEDKAPANGSSIAVLAEFNGKSVLLAGDAFPSVVLRSLQSYFNGQPIQLDVVKLSHHGSKGNTSPELIAAIRSRRFVISTNGSSFGHPDPPLVAWVIKRSPLRPTLIFNYKTVLNDMWLDPALQQTHRYKTIYPDDDKTGITVDISN